ncbi:MAG: serine esterase [Deltaproteobacteria bacterium]|nr:serine esterase [Deltaproteobacteria bacterium]
MNTSQLVHVYVPPTGGLPPSPGKLPDLLVVVLHGRGDSPAGFAWMPKVLDLKRVGYLMLQAPDRMYDGFSWYDLPPKQDAGVLRSRARISATLDELAGQGMPAERIVLFGFSQGCLMAVDVGLRYPKPLAGVCGVSGYVMWPEKAAAEATPHARTLPWLITAGREDPVIPFATTEAHVAALKAAGIPVDWRGYHKDHTIDPERELVDLRAWLAARAEAVAGR